MPFYLISEDYVGPNQDQDEHLDSSAVIITEIAPRTNLSGDIKTDGWMGTTGDWSLNAHGAFESMDDARKAVRATFGEVREIEPDGAEPHYAGRYGIVALFKIGKYAPAPSGVINGFLLGAEEAMRDLPQDDDLTAIAEECEGEANAEGYTLGTRLLEELKAIRDTQED